MPRSAFPVLLLALFAIAADKPRSHDPRIKIELFAEQPQIVTPTGIDVDSQGRVWAVESNTHFPPAGYKGHPTDRVWVMTDTDGDGKCDKQVMFLDGLTFTMSVAVRPMWLSLPPQGEKIPDSAPPTVVYIATRYAIWKCTDTNGDSVCDDKQQIVTLETKGNYPHNGLAGIAFSPVGENGNGSMFFGCGENLGADYKLVGSDKTTFSGGGEGGNIYRCRLDGSKLEHWATGFWNPHASCLNDRNELFTVDNDADSRPPCRLLHIIKGGDYGYRYRNGRKGLHPFTAWNGEIPGTLPMVAGTGEAPSGILWYDNDGLPAELRRTLLVTSWGDHRIDRFKLQKQGESFTSLPETLISGGAEFRPVGIACAPDGSLYCTDWVKRDYNLHGHGRIWKISSVKPVDSKQADLWSMADVPLDNLLGSYLRSTHIDERRMAIRLMVQTPDGQRYAKTHVTPELLDAWRMAASDEIVRAPRLDLGWDHSRQDPFRFAALITHLQSNDNFLEEPLRSRHPAARLAGILATSRVKPQAVDVVKRFLNDKDPDIRRAIIQWIAEARLKELRPHVTAQFDDPRLSTDLFLVTLAALDMLDGASPAELDKTPPSKYVLPIVADSKLPPLVRALALRMVAPNDPGLTAPLLLDLLNNPNPELQLNALRTMQQSPLPEATAKLREIAGDAKSSQPFRLEAVDGLGLSALAEAPGGSSRQLLVQLLSSDNANLRLAAIRSLRGLPDDPAVQAALIKQAKGLLSVPAETPVTNDLADQLALALGQSGENVVALAERPTVRPKSPEGWQLLLSKPSGDPVAGRRVFYHARGAGCFKCHTIEGRGGRIGPDLSSIGRSLSREKLITSILTPSAEIAPQFTSWIIETEAGKTYNGMIVFENEGKITLGTSDGQTLEFPSIDIVERTAATLSVMPEKLTDYLTIQEFRDLLAYLESLK